MANKRVFYPCQQVAIKKDGATTYIEAHGVQSVDMNTNFTLEQVFELGQFELYQNIEDVPEIEVNITKVLDGSPLLYHLATAGATTGPSLLNRANEKCLVAFGIFSDTADSATGLPLSEVETSGMFINSFTYTFPVQGNSTEQISMQGNEKVWANDTSMLQSSPWIGATTLTFSGQFGTADSPDAPGGVSRRQHFVFNYAASSALDSNGMVADADASIFPPDVFGISSSGTNELSATEGYGAHFTNVTVTAQLNREALYELGTRAPYTRTLTPPVEVTCAVTVITTSGDMVTATTKGKRNNSSSNCVNATNLQDRTIRIATCEGTRIYLGMKNKLQTTTMSGGDAGGGNVEVTYNFVTYNKCTVMHSGEQSINTAASGWWTARNTYLTN